MSGDDVLIERRPSPERPEVVVVTGASAGVGRAVARRFAASGALVGLIARGRDGLEGARADVEALGGRPLILQGDVADPEFIERAAERTEKELGPIDIWVNNATTSVFSRVKDMTAGEFRRVTEVTYLGYVYGTLAALRRMLERDRGTIVQVGSALAYRSIPLQSAYCAAKHAIEGFTESLRVELMHDRANVHVTMVHLPALNTPQFEWNKTRLPGHPQPVPPIYQPEIAAEAVYYAAHERRREMCVGYPTVIAVYGNRIAPALLDKELARSGFESQQMPERVPPDRPNNLWEPLPGNRGAHGRFDARSRSFSPQLWANMHRSWLGLGAALLAGGMVLARMRRPRAAATIPRSSV
jgi:short-subunit dehydrogenase